MDRAAIVGFLGELPHFRGLDEELLSEVAGTARTLTLSSGGVLFEEGDRASGLFAVAEGVITISRLREDGHEHIVHRVLAGRTFAEAALFHGGRYPARATASASPTRVVRLDRSRFLALFERDPRLAASMVGSLSTWLHTLLERIDTLSIASAGARLAHHLLRLPATDVDGALVVTLPTTKKDLATELTITPETLSRLLARWRDRGLVSVDGPKVTLRNVAALETLAESGA